MIFLDLVGELQELQSGTNTSTAADLLKQGAGWFCVLCSVSMQVATLYASILYVCEGVCHAGATHTVDSRRCCSVAFCHG